MLQVHRLRYLFLFLFLVTSIILIFVHLRPPPTPRTFPVINVKVEAGSKRRAKAAFVTLAQNSDLYKLAHSIRQVEDRFNKIFHYPWVFFNDEPFTEEFINITSALVSGTTAYGILPRDHWSYPEWIDQKKAKVARDDMASRGVIYGGSETYRHMCRYMSGFFYRQELLKNYDYYWRVEPDIQLFCDIDYDPFLFMQDNGKEYGFTISLPDYQETLPTLWETTKDFIAKHPDLIVKDNAMEFITPDNGKSYNRCHFWSNFEIANLNFWRNSSYNAYFNHLDRAGGFFYERWGDAPVHTIAAVMFLKPEQIHFFNDIGYYHIPFTHCPIEDEFRQKCHCSPHDSFDWKDHSCTKRWFKTAGNKLPEHHAKYAG